jgi:hypothetical protein
MLTAVHAYVARERERIGVTATDERRKPEPSGEAHNEFALLLDVQLLTTTSGYGAWNDLKDFEILSGVYGVVAARANKREGL